MQLCIIVFYSMRGSVACKYEPFGQKNQCRNKYFAGEHLGLQDRACFVATVEDRMAETLVYIIKQRIKPGTTIISDCWRAQGSLSSEVFTHLTINHPVNFVDPDSGAHTKTIQPTHLEGPKEIAASERNLKILYDSYFSQYCIRKLYLNFAEDPFLSFLNLISEVYLPNKAYCIAVPAIQPLLIPRNPSRYLTQNLNNSLDDFQI